MTRIAIFGGSFNPPGKHHKEIVLQLLAHGIVDRVVVIPCGQRTDKAYEDSEKRIHVMNMAFRDIEGCSVNNFNLELNVFTSNYRYEKMLGFLGELWHVVGSDLIVGAHKKESSIQKRWENGESVFNTLNFIVIRRPGFDFTERDLPAKCVVVDMGLSGSSTEIRTAINTPSVEPLLDSTVLKYIRNNKIYGAK